MGFQRVDSPFGRGLKGDGIPLIGGKMEEIKSSVMAICAASAAVCIVESLVSGTKLKNQMKLILDLILITVIAAPFIRGAVEFDLSEFRAYDTPDYEYSRELYNEELRRQTSYNVSEVLLEQISAAGIRCDKIETEVNISDDGSISITKVTLIADNFEKAADIIRKSLGEETEVVNENI